MINIPRSCDIFRITLVSATLNLVGHSRHVGIFGHDIVFKFGFHGTIPTGTRVCENVKWITSTPHLNDAFASAVSAPCIFNVLCWTVRIRRAKTFVTQTYTDMYTNIVMQDVNPINQSLRGRFPNRGTELD